MGRKKKYATEDERKEAKRLYLKQWREANREKILEQMKQWREANKEKIAEYRQVNAEKRIEYSKQWYKTNKEKKLEQQKQWYKANKEKTLEQHKQWYRDNPNYNKQYYQCNKDKEVERKKKYHQTPMGRAKNLVRNYKQSDKEMNRGECTLTAKWIVDNIFASKCIYCGESDWKELGCDRKDNSLPHTEYNVVCSCGECNVKRGSKSFEEFLAECKQKDLEDIAIK